MTLRLAVFDLDGTLAKVGQPAKLEVSRKLRKLERLGIKIVFASGKNVSYLRGFARGIGVNPVFIIAENGCLVFDVEKIEEKKLVKVTEEMLKIKNEVLKQFGESVWIQPSYVELTVVPKNQKMIQNLASFICRVAEPYKDELVTIVHEDAVDVLPAQINKGKGLLEVMKVLNIPKDEVVAIGDESSDIPMFKNAGLSVVVGNNPIAYSKAKRFNDICKALNFLNDVFSAHNG